MLTENEFYQARDSSISQMQGVIKELGSVSFPAVSTLQFHLRSLTNKNVEKLLGDVPTGHRTADENADFVYVVRLLKPSKELVERIWDRLEKARGDERDYCQVNRNHDDPGAIYVGRSRTLRSRLRQHLGSESRRVYAMHMQRWAGKIDAEVSISYLRFDGAENLLVQAIEDGLWSSLKPALGKKGGR